MKNIVLCCAAGMSTSMLVQRMKDAAQKKGVDVPLFVTGFRKSGFLCDALHTIVAKQLLL